MNHAPLFAGINGFGYAADILGWNQPFHCEIDDFCQKVIQYHWPNSKPYYDIKKTDFSIWRGKIDILSGGFPCQPFSNAGNRNGVDDNRYLWPEYLRAIREIKPLAVVGENVTGLLTMEQHEMFFRVDSRRTVRFQNYDEYEAIYSRQATMLVNDICKDLEQEGYDVQTFVIPSAGVGAPHKRDRIWFVANSIDCGYWGKEHGIMGEETGIQKKDRKERSRPRLPYRTNNVVKGYKESSRICNQEFITNPNNKGLQGSKEQRGSGKVWEKRNEQSARCFQSAWEKFPTEPPICSGNDGLPTELDGITFSKWRNESIKAYGNAIVPQVAYQIFKAIQDRYESRICDCFLENDTCKCEED